NMRTAVALFAILALVPVTASADTLYVAAPPPAGPGHPLRLGPDHRAQQIGDLVYVQFDFNDANAHTNDYNSAKSSAINTTGGFGNFNISLLKNTSGIAGSSQTQTTQSATGADSFVSTMMAMVTNVLPSGTLEIAGDQGVVINGRQQTLHITGYVRPEDIDSSDAILSSRVADVHATFKGDDQKNKGLLSRIMSWLF
ncbi:MAG: flagellar basal body L-ring protein FlgH, partial [Vulcanimicrobiaceae bacterium]